MHITIDQPFDLKSTLDCGQGHRWLPARHGWYEGVLGHNLVLIRQDGERLEFHTAADEADIARQLSRQFRLRDPIEAIYEELSRDDPVMAMLVRKFRGLRVMRTDPWECLVFFILTANSTIELSQRRMEQIATEFRVSPPLGDSDRYPFPRPSDLCERGALEKMRSLNFGLDKETKVHETASVVHRRQPYLNAMKTMSNIYDVIKGLRKLPGVDHKSANCVALFSLDKVDAFPIDKPHILKSLNHFYGNEPDYPKLKTPAAVRRWKWCRNKFGPYAGYASQFLFIYSYRHLR